MYTDEYLARHKNYSSHDEHYYPSEYKYNKTNCSGYNWYCPYAHICPLLNQQSKHYEYPMMQIPRSNYSLKDDLFYREENYDNNFRHPFGHMSYYYDDHYNGHDHNYDYDNHHDHDYEDHDHDYNTYPYVNHGYYEHEFNPYYYQSPFTQYPILPQLPYFEEEEDEHEEHDHHHDNE